MQLVLTVNSESVYGEEALLTTFLNAWGHQNKNKSVTVYLVTHGLVASE